MNATKKYWFPAKKYGWGWGLPTTWQGWFVFVAYLSSVALLAVFYPPDAHEQTFFLGIVGASLILLVVCWLKGEPPRWRWGRMD